jgi:hypothetical protein
MLQIDNSSKHYDQVRLETGDQAIIWAIQGKNSPSPSDSISLANIPHHFGSRPDSCSNIDQGGRLSKPPGGIAMRVNAKTLVKSSHDFILIVGAVIAIAMIASEMVHNWRSVPKNLGMATVAESRLASR